MESKKGIALILVVGILAILAIIATSFSLSMRLEYRAAMNYYNGVKARYFAESALARAIAGLRTHVKSSAFDDLVSANEIWSTTGYNNDGLAGSPDITTNITGKGTSRTLISASDKGVVDEQRKINVNNASSLLLENLVAVLKNKATGYGILDTGDGTEIFNHRPALPSRYWNLKEVVIQTSAGAGGADDKIDKDEMALLEQFITAYSYEDANNAKRSPINVNTARQETIAAVIKGIANSSTTNGLPVISAITTDEAWNVADHIVNGTKKRPFTRWQGITGIRGFDEAIDDAVAGGHISTDQATLIKYNCNPNRPKPLTGLISTTEFCFNSGGYYTITAQGTVTDNLTGLIPQADRTISAVVKIYDIYCETKVKVSSSDPTPTQFALGRAERVTWLDSCPVVSQKGSFQLFNSYDAIPSDIDKVNDSIKLGFWDDFNSDAASRAYSISQWQRNLGGYVNASDFSDVDVDGDDELKTTENIRCDIYGLTDADNPAGFRYWTWGDFTMRVHANEYDTGSANLMKHAAWIFFRKQSGIIPYAGHPGVFHSTIGTSSWQNPSRFAYPNIWSAPQQIVFLEPGEALARSAQYGNFPDLTAATNGKYSYPPQIRIVTAYLEGSVPPLSPIPASGWPCEENMDTSTYKTDLTASNTKTFILATRQLAPPDSKDITLTVWTNPTTVATHNRKIVDSVVQNRDGTTTSVSIQNSGRIVLYGWNVKVAWDNIRIIPGNDPITGSPAGNFVSQEINQSIPGCSALAGGVEWGTITGTVTIPSTANAATESVTLQTMSSTDPDWGIYYRITSPLPVWHAAGGNSQITSGSSAAGPNPIRYKTDFTTTNPTMHETPVLEDITITYLPKVEIVSYSLSQ